jgi:FKBP-type peptidyl-prolyl cis-trans isomerase
MNKFKFYFLVLSICFSIFSCTEDEVGFKVEPPRAYDVQYTADNTLIEEYLKNNYITVLDKPGLVDDQDITITKRGANDKENKSIWDQTKYKLLSKDVILHDIKYKVYYLVLRQGVGESPCNVDGVLAAYKGFYIRKSTATATVPAELSTTFFEESRYPQTIFELKTTITGWSEIFPKFKSGTYVIKEDGTVSHNDFGAGVIFIPSGLGYYNRAVGSIPAYSPLVFSFKLYDIKRLDSDKDGIFNFQEGRENDGYMYDYRNTINYPKSPKDVNIYEDDTDEDGIPDYLDIDDDGDGTSTKIETKRPDLVINGINISNGYFPFDGAKDTNGNPFDDPATPNINEGQGIPSYEKDRAENKLDYTSPNRIRVHLNKDYPLKP